MNPRLAATVSRPFPHLSNLPDPQTRTHLYFSQFADVLSAVERKLPRPPRKRREPTRGAEVGGGVNEVRKRKDQLCSVGGRARVERTAGKCACEREKRGFEGDKEGGGDGGGRGR